MPAPLGTTTNSPVLDQGTLALAPGRVPTPSCGSKMAPTAQVNTDISRADGEKIMAEAMTWIGTPYALVGPQSAKGEGGDCSGSTFKIYGAAGFPYDYQTAGGFQEYAVSSGRFREIDIASESLQSGDILSWSSHMAIHVNFPPGHQYATTDRINKKGSHWTQKNDMFTATHTGGPNYQAGKREYFRPDQPRVFRYQRVPGGACQP